MRVCIIKRWQGEHDIITGNFVKLLEPLTTDTFIIAGNISGNAKVVYGQDVVRIKKEYMGSNILRRIFNYTLVQVNTSLKLIRQARNFDLAIFYTGGIHLVLAMVSAKLLRKKTLLIIVGTRTRAAADQHFTQSLVNRLGWQFFKILRNLNLRMADKLVVHTENCIKEFGLEEYKDKIFITPEHFIDLDKFYVRKPLQERKNLVGCIGRLHEEKGILNFMEALPLVIDRMEDVRFLIAGDGPLRSHVEAFLAKHHLNHKVNFVGWIHHDDVPRYLNDLKLLVLPSYMEGFSYIRLEAAACGTPFLANAVGSMPDVIKDGETGFLMENNSPECIASNILRALNHPNLEQIIRNARALVERNATYDKAVERYRETLSHI